jgi:hypothetical protein
MKKLILSVTAAVMAVQCIYAQTTAPIVKETWTEKPVIKPLDPKFAKEAAVILFDKRRIEYIDETKDDLAEYYTMHRLIYIVDDRGLEGFNKIYLPINENADIVDVRARAILTNGKIIELDKNNIKEITDKDGSTYKIFAMDGLEKGCEVEYYYTIKRSTSYFGRESVQETIPIEESSVQIIAPARLRFEIKSYNFSVTPADSVAGDKHILQCVVKETPGADEEKYAYQEANLERIEYKLSYNDSGSKGERLFTWNELAKRIFDIYTFSSEKETKAVAALVQENGWDKLTDETQKIIAVENYVKKTFAYDEQIKSDDGNALTSILQNKNTGTIGIMRLYTSIFQTLGVKYQFVLTGDRQKMIIDRAFENWNNCDYPVFYFPAENTFMAPTRPDYRYPWIMPLWGATNGLYCKTTTLGSLTTAIAEVKPIPLEDYTKSYEDIDSKLELNPTQDSLSIDEKQIYAGYAATTYRAAYTYSNDEQKKDMIKELTKMFASSENILSSEVLNPELEKSDEAMTIHTKTKSGELIEQAGSKLLLKIGLAMGPQVEMYQEKPRQEPVEMDFPHIEERHIQFVIPAGYTISNPNDLNISQTYMENGQLTMGFVSDYVVKGNILSVHIMEQYRRTTYPLTQFQQFQKIINASADFNKVVLVLEKKSS